MKKHWMLAALLALLLAVPVRAWEDAPADADRTPEEAVGTLIEPDSEWTPLDRGQAGRGEVEDPDKYWATNGYPDFVSYAFEAGGELLEDGTVETWWEIGLVDASREEEVLDLLAPTCRIQFFPCRYSYDQRQAALDEILSQDDARITRAMLGQNTEAVFVWTSEADREAVQQELNAAYGSLVQVLDSMVVDDTTAQMGMDKGGMAVGQREKTASPLPWVLTAVAALLGIGGILLLHRRPSPLTTAGHTVAPPTRSAVVRAVRESTMTPGEQVFQALEERLNS